MSSTLSPSLQAAHNAVPYSRPSSPLLRAPQIGFVGLGNMGYLMAQNLANHTAALANGSPPLLVWNRSVGKAEQLVKSVGQDKVHIAQNLEELAHKCDVIITNLANDAVVKDVFSKFTEALTRSPPSRTKIFVETSTIYPTLAGELEQLISTIPHARLITCPVFGTPAVAAKAQLILVMSGDYHTKKEIGYLLVPAIGRKVFDLGGNLEKAPTFKLIGNSMIIGTLEVLSEAYTLAEKSGIGSENVHNLIKEVLPAPGTIAYSDRIANDKFDGSTGFAIDGGIKDASHIRQLTAAHNSPMPAIDIAHQHLLTARAVHTAQKQAGKATFDILDWSGIVVGARVAAGLDGLDSRQHEKVVRED